MKQLGDTEPVRGQCNNMGIDSSRQSNGRYYIQPGSPAICLGAADLTVMQMTGAYSAFANKGMYGTPYVIRRIEDKNGRVLYRSIQEEKFALPENANWVMVEMLKYNVRALRVFVNSKARWVAKRVQPMTTPMAGLWALRHDWLLAPG